MVAKLAVLVAVVVIIQAGLATGQQHNSGFKARITTQGFNYANDVAVTILGEKVKTLKIPDQHGKSGDVTFDLTGMRITSFVPPKSKIVLNAGSGLTWSATGMSISAHGDFRYKYKKSWKKLSGHGSFDLSANNVGFSVAIRLGTDTTGRPMISDGGCTSSIGSVNVKFHGSWAWIYNLFRKQAGNMIKKILTGQICTLVKGAIDKDAAKALAKLPVTVDIAKKFLLDYRLISKPTFTAGYMETMHKGEIYWSKDVTEAPFPPPAMPGSADSGHMLYLWVSDYLFNTIGYAAQKHGYLTRNVTTKDLSPDKRGVLNTTCTSPICLGNIIPELGKKFPNSQVELNLTSVRDPVMNITSGLINVTCAGDITMNVRLSTGVLIVSALTLNATMSTSINVSVAETNIYAQIKDIRIVLDVKKSSVIPVKKDALQWIVDHVVITMVKKELNDLGSKGFPLPLTKNVHFVNTKLYMLTNTLLIATDIKYQSKMDTVLRFTSLYTDEGIY